ncbi:MAG: DEAD/DEAH box helicase [Candidatus Accumulibacter sp.]|nr:DEAD/DEAH box helicase [Accumulibacter sp.]
MTLEPSKLTLPENPGTFGLTPEIYPVAAIAALLWTYASPSDLYRALSSAGLNSLSGKPFTMAEIKRVIEELRRHGLIDDDAENPKATDGKLVDSLRIPLYRHLLQANPGQTLVRIIAATHRYEPGYSSFFWGLSKRASIAYFRAKYLSGASYQEISPQLSSVSRTHDGPTLIYLALIDGFDGATFEFLDPSNRWLLAYRSMANLCLYWSTEYLPIADWLIGQLGERPNELPADIRLIIGDLAFQRDDRSLLAAAIAGIDDGTVDGLQAAAQVIAGDWSAGQSGFEKTFKQRKSSVGSGKHLLPESFSWLYPLALLAQGTPKHLELARKFCASQAGKREPNPYSPWGRWAHAIDVRLGKTPLQPQTFNPPSATRPSWNLETLWTMLLAAWLGAEAIRPANAQGLAKEWAVAGKILRQQAHQVGVRIWLPLIDGAEAVLAGKQPPRGFFIANAGEQWRDILTALQTLGGTENAASADGPANRLVWEIEIGAEGRLQDIRALEQKRGTRGWGRPQTISFGRIIGREDLPIWDGKVARALRRDRTYSNRYSIDLATAIVALVGHPCVVLANAPGQFVELVEAAPELELIRRGDRFVMRVEPPLRTANDFDEYQSANAEERRELDALRLITLVLDGPQRLRLVRFNAAQRQAAQLVSGHFAVPADAADASVELEKTLRALSGQFQVHAEPTQATRQVASESQLRAELSPLGEHLTLRLIAAPLGPDGPRLAAASGRHRVIAVLDGETVGTERDLASERRHLEAVVDALPFLDAAEGQTEWLVEDPELALAMIETLPTLPAIAAVDWPKGKPVRVLSVDSRQLGLRISRERDWFRVAGSAHVDEGLVLQLDALLQAARSPSRFVPMGDGIYAALTRSLKQKLNDLAAVLEADQAGGKVPMIAASWLDDVLDGTTHDASRDFRQAIDRLRQAQEATHRVPGLLQTKLRPYQEDGYQWAMRLASAGMGGCLADDMGLGKTLQALAVLLERATGGPALVVAPTSVCGNWLAEVGRFAPTLQARIYGEASEGTRDELIQAAGPQDLLIVSYTLLQLAQERFNSRNWHTVIADEAQAIKNAVAKRSQAAFELPADFRLALTGTPVENRLADLWSIMRFANPGLLGSLNRFNERFVGPIERHRDRNAQHLLKRLIGPFVLRRTKTEVLQELPSRTELILRVTPEATEAAHYEAIRRQAVDDISQTLHDTPATQATFNILAQLTRLRRAACDPRLTSPQFDIAGAKVQAFAELVGELLANGHKALVFSQFVDFLRLLREPLDTAGIAYQYLDGATPAGERTRRVNAFQNGEGDLFLISLKAGGFGLNLTAADYVVITDPWWNPAAEDQATGRAHRIGQSRPVTVYRLVTRGTVEERIVDLHHEKRTLADSILADGQTGDLPSADDLIALIRGD